MDRFVVDLEVGAPEEVFSRRGVHILGIYIQAIFTALFRTNRLY